MRALHILLATNRPAIYTFFLSLRGLATHHVVVSRIPLSGDASISGAVPCASVAAVDVALDPMAAMSVCQGLRHRRPDLPLLGLICCPRAVTPWQLQALLAAGVDSFLDLQATAGEVLRLLYAVSQGDIVLRARLNGEHTPRRVEHRSGGADVRHSAPALRLLPAAHAELLALVAQGLPDKEIGQRLHLSPHTVKHHVDRLRDEYGARNRIALAAWAGQLGLYRPETIED